MSSESTAPAPGKRDPEGRRRAIIEAAAEIIVTRGPSALTHRAVAAEAGVSLGSTTQYFASLDELREAALEDLAHEIERLLLELEESLDTGASLPEVLARDTYEFLSNERAVRADVALLAIGVTEPDLRALALMWTDRLIEILSPRVGSDRALAIALCLDGATLHAALHEEPLSEDEIFRIISALVTMPTLPEN